MRYALRIILLGHNSNQRQSGEVMEQNLNQSKSEKGEVLRMICSSSDEDYRSQQESRQCRSQKLHSVLYRDIDSVSLKAISRHMDDMLDTEKP